MSIIEAIRTKFAKEQTNAAAAYRQSLRAGDVDRIAEAAKAADVPLEQVERDLAVLTQAKELGRQSGQVSRLRREHERAQEAAKETQAKLEKTTAPLERAVMEASQAAGILGQELDNARTAARNLLTLIQATPDLLSMADGPEETRLLLERDGIEKELRDAQGRRNHYRERREEAERRLPHAKWQAGSGFASPDEEDRRRVEVLETQIAQATQEEAVAQQDVEEAERKLAKATSAM
jgi:hypothetical protein